MSKMTDPGVTRWHRETWLKAIWDTDAVKPNERLVAHVFAHYANDRKTTWCTWDELRRRTGIKSRDAINRAIRGLLDAGWLKETEKARQHFSARYEMTIPTGQGSGQGSGKRTSQQSGKRTPATARGGASSPADGHPSSPSPETRSPANGPDIPTTDTRQETSGGHAAPPQPPLRQDPPQAGCLNDQRDSPPEVVTNQPDLATQPTTRAHAENNVIELRPAKCPHGLRNHRHPDGIPKCPLCRRTIREAS